MAADTAAAIAAVKSKMGSKYVWGDDGPNTFDCSGLMQWAWGQAGVQLPRTSEQQATYGQRVARVEDLQPGDLITSHWGRGGPSSHVAMYLGGGTVIHAPAPGKVVTTGKIDANYRKHIDAMRRVPGAKAIAGGVGQAGLIDPDTIPGIGGGLLDLGQGLLNSGALGDGLLGPLKALAESSVGIARAMLSVGDLATWVLRLGLPSTWVRIVSGLLGTVFLFLGIVFLVRETQGA